MAWSTQNVWWRNSSAPGTFSGLFPRVRAYADPEPLPQAGGVRHRYTRTPPPRHSPGWLGGTLGAGPGPLIDPHGAHGGLGPTPPIPPLGHPTRHPALVIWLRKRRLAGHPKNVLKKAAERFDLPASLIERVQFSIVPGARLFSLGKRILTRHPCESSLVFYRRKSPKINKRVHFLTNPPKNAHPHHPHTFCVGRARAGPRRDCLLAAHPCAGARGSRPRDMSKPVSIVQCY